MEDEIRDTGGITDSAIDRCSRLFDLNPDPCFITNDRGIARGANREAERLLGVPERLVSGRPLALHVREEDRGLVSRVLEELRHRERSSVELGMKIAKGAVATMLVAAAAVSPAGQEPLVIWSMKDISELRRAADGLRWANEELDRYARTVSHDLKGPLSSILLGTEFIRESLGALSGDEERRQVAETATSIENNARVAFSLVNEILSQAHLYSPVDPEAVTDVEAEVRRIVHEESVAGEREVDVYVGRGLGKVRASEVHVLQVFSNLVTNASRHNPAARVGVWIEALGETPDGQRRFMVGDNGRGLPPAVASDIAECRVGGGARGALGLGLTIVCDIITRYGGYIRAYNQDGARVEFSLPAAGQTRRGGAPDRGPPRVLVVEDEPGAAYMIVTLLRKRLGAEATAAESVGAARLLLKSSRFDAVTVDYRLPDGSGLELLRDLSALGEPPPVVVLTGRGDENVASRSMGLGAAGYVVKSPSVATELPETIRKALRAG